MKRNFVMICMLLLFAISLNAAPRIPEAEEKYWVTETGPRSNPYTVIRLYNEAHQQFLEILLNGYRLKTGRPAMIKRLNSLANTANPGDTGNIAALLRIKACRVSAVKKINEQAYCKIK